MSQTITKELRAVFLRTTIGVGVLIFVAVWLGWRALLSLDAQHRLAEHFHNHQERLARALDAIREEGERLAAELEHLRLANLSDQQLSAQLTAFFTRIASYERFADVVLYQGDSHPIYARGCPAQFDGYPGTHRLGENREKTIFFFEMNPCSGFPQAWVATPFWLGLRGSGWLLLGFSLDHGWLYTLANRGEAELLFLFFRNQIVASSLGEQGVAQPISATEQIEINGDVFTVQGVATLTPEMNLVFRQSHRPLVTGTAAALFAMGIAFLVTGLLWLLVGRWANMKGALIVQLAKASACFRTHFQRSNCTPYLQLLQHQPNELGQLASDLDQLMTEVEKRQEALSVMAWTLELLQEAVLILDERGQIVSASPAWRRLIGEDHPTNSVDTFAAFLPERECRSWSMLLDNLRAEGSGATGQMRLTLIASSGSDPRWIEARVVFLGAKYDARFCVVVREITEAIRQEEQFRFLALHDPLTHLPNRRLFAERFALAKAFADRDTTLLAVCLLDLDGFKPVNDRFGHAAGDQLLVEVSRRLQQELRDTDTVARLGGDEFALLLVGLKDMAEVETILQHLIEAVSAPYVVEGCAVNVTASIGLTCYPLDTAEEIDTLLRHADLAMYRAKQQGRNRFCLFDVQEFQEEIKTSHTIVAFKDALRRGEMVLYYQPKIDLRTGLVAGVEALIRWHHPERGLISPAAFIPVVEKEHSLSVALGEWVIDTALQQIAQWQAAGVAWPVSVNLISHHFLQPDFPKRLAALLARYPTVSPSFLEIEVVESTLITDLAVACQNLSACRALGISASLDDFGTGYSSLAYLKELPITVVKLDRSFVSGLLDQPRSLQLVQSVIELVHRLGMAVVAEGVESRDEGFILQRLGCEYVQGYAFARPMPAEALQEWYQHYRPDEELCKWGNLLWSFDDLPLLLANRDVSEWAKRLERYLEGGHLALEEIEIGDPHQCRFGQWYYQRGQLLRDLPSFAHIEPVHDYLHELGQQIVALCRAGDRGAAKALLPELHAVKEQLTALVDQLHQELFSQQNLQNMPRV